MGDDQKRLYVGNLPTEITEDDVRSVFELYGAISDVCINKLGLGDQRRSAFVGFAEEHDATAAMLVLSEMYKFRETMTPIFVKAARSHENGAGDRGSRFPDDDRSPEALVLSMPAPPPPMAQAQAFDRSSGQQVGGGSCSNSGTNISFVGGGKAASPESKLWVGSLPGDTTKEVLEKVFGNYGRITEINLMPIRARSGQACAFVHFSTPEEADACVAAMAMGYEIRPGTGPIMVERPGSRSKGKGLGKGPAAPLPPPGMGVGPAMALMGPPGMGVGPAMAPGVPMVQTMGAPAMGFRYQPY